MFKFSPGKIGDFPSPQKPQLAYYQPPGGGKKQGSFIIAFSVSDFVLEDFLILGGERSGDAEFP